MKGLLLPCKCIIDAFNGRYYIKPCPDPDCLVPPCFWAWTAGKGYPLVEDRDGQLHEVFKNPLEGEMKHGVD